VDQWALVGDAVPADKQAATRTTLMLSLLGGFRLVDLERRVEPCRGPAAQRLVALLALRSTAVSRDLVAGVLWPDVAESCAHAALRSALARLARCSPGLVSAAGHHLSLSDRAWVDLHEGRRLAGFILRPGSHVALDVAVASIPGLSRDLLPGWYDDWVIEEAESWRQLRLHALESLADALCRRRRFGEAITAASAAVTADPLRETARAAMIRIHRAEGNRSEAVREFERYRRLILRALGEEPTPRLRSLVASV
jgi:DNA-binding SARP family transcriptional activator